MTDADYLWKPESRIFQAEAVAMPGNAALYAGRMLEGPKGAAKYILRVHSLADGKKLSEIALDSPPAYDGLAAADSKVYLTLQDGTLVCFGQ